MLRLILLMTLAMAAFQSAAYAYDDHFTQAAETDVLARKADFGVQLLPTSYEYGCDHLKDSPARPGGG